MTHKLILVTLLLAGFGAAPVTASRVVDVDVDTSMTGPGSPFYPEEVGDPTAC